MSILPDDAQFLPRTQKRELMAELHERAEASLRAAHPRVGGRAVNDTDAAYVALAMTIPYRCKHFRVDGDYSEQIAYFSKRIGPIAPALSSVFSGMKWTRAARFT